MNRHFALAPANPAPGFAGQQPWVNPITGVIEWVNSLIIDDCLMSGVSTGGCFGWQVSVLNSGSGSVGMLSADTGHNGSLNMLTNALSNAAAVAHTVGSAMHCVAGYKQRLLKCIKTPALSDGTDRYQIFSGFGDSTGAVPVDGVYFNYSDVVNSGNWQGVTAIGSVTSTATGGSNVLVAANTWYWLYIEFDGTVANFWVATDRTDRPGTPGAFTFIGRSTTNLPVGIGAVYGLNTGIIKSVGTNNRSLSMDKAILAL